MVMPVGRAELKQDRGRQLPPGLQVLPNVHDHNGWPQTNIDSGAEHDWPGHISEEGGPSGTYCVSHISTPRGNTNSGKDAHAMK